MGIPIPASTGTLLDGGLAIVAADVSNIHCKIGVCSGGVAGTMYSFAGTDTNNVVTTLGTGPLVDSVIDSLAKSGGKTCYAFKPATVTTAGVSGSVTRVGTSPTITLSGAPFDYAENVVKIVLGGAVGTATFQQSYDGGDTYGPVTTTAATTLGSNNVTITWTAGTYVAGDTESWTDTAPVMTSSDLSTALDSVIADPNRFGFVHIVGQVADAATTLTVATMVQGKAATALAAKKPMWFLLEAPAVDKSTLISTFPAFAEKFVLICAGFMEYTNVRTGGVDKKSSGRPVAARAARNPIWVDLSRTADDSDLDPIAGVVKLVPSGAAASTGYHDEAATPGLNAARFTSLCTIPGRSGFFITNPLTMASGTSDYQLLQMVRIATRAFDVFYQFSTTQLSARIRKDKTTGFILPSVADALEDASSQLLTNALKNAVDGVRVLINRADNLSSDNTLRAKIRFIGPAYAKTISWEMGFAVALP